MSPEILQDKICWWRQVGKHTEAMANIYWINTFLMTVFVQLIDSYNSNCLINYPDRRTAHMCIGHVYGQMHFWKKKKKLFKSHPQAQFLAQRRDVINIKINMNKYQYISFYWNWGGLSLEVIPGEMWCKAITRALLSLCWFYNSRWLYMNLSWAAFEITMLRNKCST